MQNPVGTDELNVLMTLAERKDIMYLDICIPSAIRQNRTAGIFFWTQCPKLSEESVYSHGWGENFGTGSKTCPPKVRAISLFFSRRFGHIRKQSEYMYHGVFVSTYYVLQLFPSVRFHGRNYSRVPDTKTNLAILVYKHVQMTKNYEYLHLKRNYAYLHGKSEQPGSDVRCNRMTSIEL